MWAFTSPGITTWPDASITLSKGPGMASIGAMRVIRPSSTSRACPSSTLQGVPKVRIVPFWMSSRVDMGGTGGDALGSGDFLVEGDDELVEFGGFLGEELVPVFGIPLGADLFVSLALLLDPGEVLQVMDGLLLGEGQLLEVVHGLALEAADVRLGCVHGGEGAMLGGLLFQ